jgi:hypothetical protein
VCWVQLVSSANDPASVKTRRLIKGFFSVILRNSQVATDPTAFIQGSDRIYRMSGK